MINLFHKLIFKRSVNILLLSFLLILLQGCKEDKLPIEVVSYSEGFRSKLKITSVVDKVAIYDVKTNRGNCNNNFLFTIKLAKQFGEKTPNDLLFGKTLSLFADCDQIKEAEIKTDLGDYYFTFD